MLLALTPAAERRYVWQTIRTELSLALGGCGPLPILLGYIHERRGPIAGTGSAARATRAR
jgi:hypothetical protein